MLGTGYMVNTDVTWTISQVSYRTASPEHMLIGFEGQKPTNNKKLTVIPHYYPAYSVEAEIQLKTMSDGNWNQLFVFSTGIGDMNDGGRLPLVSQIPNSRRLHITSHVGDEHNFVYNWPEV